MGIDSKHDMQLSNISHESKARYDRGKKRKVAHIFLAAYQHLLLLIDRKPENLT